jgi:nitronate monooxygenase
MWSKTPAAHRLGIDWPILQGPFGGGLSSVRLAAEVSNAGGLGSFGAHHLAPAAIRQTIVALRGATARPFAVNLWVSNEDPEVASFGRAELQKHLARLRPFYDELGVPLPAAPERYGERFEEQVEALIEAAPPVFSFVYGIPEPHILEACRARRIVTVATVTTPEEAIAAEAAGVDLIVATGSDAGGHRVSFLHRSEDVLTGTFSLIPQVRDSVRLPVIAAGGIADGRGIAAALMLGADGVQIGTAFLACEESAASPPHRAALFSQDARRTVLTRAFTGRLARGIPNRYVEEMSRHEGDFAPYPAQSWLAGGFKQAAIGAGRGDLISLWAGQAAPLVRHKLARGLFDELVATTGAALAQLPQRRASATQ